VTNNGATETRRPGLLQVMRLAGSKDFKRSVERSQMQLNHGHEMLAQLYPAEHERIHATAINEDLRKSIPEMAGPVENGLCMYRMISFLYWQKFGALGFAQCKEKFPGVDVE